MQYIKRRLLLIALGIVVFLISYSIGSIIPLDKDYSQKLKNTFIEKVSNINYVGIFMNNLLISLFMFVPLLGTIFGLFSGFSTGNVFHALSINSPILSQISPLVILITPFGILEMFSYGIAISRSAIIFFKLLKGKSLIPEILPTLLEIGIVALLLFIGAVIESSIISKLGTHNSTSVQLLNRTA